MKKLVFILMLVGLVLVSSCKCPSKQAAMQPMPSRSPCEAAAMARTSQTFPTTTAGGAIMLEKMAPTEVITNQPFDYRIKVTNLTDRELSNVVVKDQIPTNLVFKSSTPEMMGTPEGQVSWSLGTLGPKASQMISVTAVASGTGSVASCAEVSYDSPICAKISIVEPKLAIAKTAPSELLVCDRIPLTYVVTNNGSGVACDITVEDQLPEGLTASDGSNKVTFRVDSLAAGQSRQFETTVDAGKPGRYSSIATATWQGVKAESDMPATIVSQPVLAISESAPAKEYIGRPVTYEITVTNNGDGIAKDTVVEAWLPEDVKFESATESGQFTHMSPGKVTWRLGELRPNSSEKVSVTFMPEQSGSVSAKMVAKAYCAESVSSSAETVVTGISGILLEVVDQMDPVEIGQNEIYTITVTNQGSVADTNIRIVCELEDGMTYVSSSGSTTGALSGNKIEFAPLNSLASKERASWQVTVRATGAGDMRFKTSLTSDQLTRPVEETEATNFYK